MKKIPAFFLALLLIASVTFGAAIVPQGDHALIFQNNLQFGNNGASILTGAIDPTATPTDALPGSAYFSTSTLKAYIKKDAGLSINWDRNLFLSDATTSHTPDTIVKRNGLGNILAFPDYASTQMVFVSKGGSDVTGDGSPNSPYLTVGHAVPTITDATFAKRYSIILGPGLFSETVTLTDNINLVGAGQDTTTISTVNYTGVAVTGRTEINYVRITTLNTNTSGGGVGGINVIFNDARADTWNITAGSYVGNNQFVVGGSQLGNVAINSGNLQVTGLKLATGAWTIADGAANYIVLVGCTHEASITATGQAQVYAYASLILKAMTGVPAGGHKPFFDFDAVSYPELGLTPSQWTLSYETFAPYMGYNPTTPSNWSSIPVTVQDGLDYLAVKTAVAGAPVTNNSPLSVTTTNSVGISTSASRADHTHQGVHSMAANGFGFVFGDVVLNAGSNVSLGQNGQNIYITATASSGNFLPTTGGTMTGDITMTANQIHSMADPTAAQDAATKAYVDSVAANGVAKGASVYATTAALPVNVYSNGASGVGATLTGVGFGALSLDGNAVSIGQRVLIKNEVTQANNGIYVVTATGGGAAVYVLTRAVDFNSSSDIVDGATTFITSGATLSMTTWELAIAGPVTVGTTALVFNQIAGPGTILAGTGLTLTGNTLSITNTAVSAGTYTNPTITVNAQGQITSAANGSASSSSSIYEVTQYGLGGITVTDQIEPPFVYDNPSGKCMTQVRVSAKDSGLTGSSLALVITKNYPGASSWITSTASLAGNNGYNSTLYSLNPTFCPITGDSFTTTVTGTPNGAPRDLAVKFIFQ